MILTRFLCCCLIALTACSSDSLTSAELDSYIQNEKNGLKKSNEINGFRVEVSYMPTDFWVNQEVSQSAEILKIENLREKYNHYFYFVLSLSNDNKEALSAMGNFAEYGELVKTMSFRMPNYVNLTTPSGDVIPVGDFMLNRTYQMGSSTDLLFVFSNERIEANDWIQFNLNEFGLGLGDQQFRFAIKDLNNAPKIKFE